MIMKKLFTFLALMAFLSGIESRAAILIGSLSPITTATTNSPTFATNTAYVSLPQISVSNNGLAISNAYNGSFRFSIDNGTTWFTNNSPQFNPATTNAGVTVILAQTVQIPIQVQMLATTNTANTSTIQIGVTSP
jgi:hypothetical protein